MANDSVALNTHHGIRSKAFLKRAVSAAIGPLLSFIPLFALPLIGGIALTSSDFAFWALLTSVATISLSLDFGGVALLTTRYHFEPRLRILAHGCGLSSLGSAIVGLFATAVWLILARGSFAGVVGPLEGCLAILVMSAAIALRSALLVIAQAALLEGWISLRNVATAAHPFAALGATIAWLALDRSYWALPFGWAISGLIFLPICVVWFLRMSQVKPHEMRLSGEFKAARFTSIRTVNTVIAAAVLQSDRWIIALIGGPAWVTVYEIAWRFAALPRALLQVLAVHLSADIAQMTREHRKELVAAVRRSTKLSIALGCLAIPCSAVGYFVYVRASEQNGYYALFVLMVVAFTALALTAPMSIAGSTVGRAGIDLPSATITLTGCLIVAFIATKTGIWTFLIGYPIVLMVTVPYYFYYAPRAILDALDKRGPVDENLDEKP